MRENRRALQLTWLYNVVQSATACWLLPPNSPALPAHTHRAQASGSVTSHVDLMSTVPSQARSHVYTIALPPLPALVDGEGRIRVPPPFLARGALRRPRKE